MSVSHYLSFHFGPQILTFLSIMPFKNCSPRFLNILHLYTLVSKVMFCVLLVLFLPLAFFSSNLRFWPIKAIITQLRIQIHSISSIIGSLKYLISMYKHPYQVVREYLALNKMHRYLFQTTHSGHIFMLQNMYVLSTNLFSGNLGCIIWRFCTYRIFSKISTTYQAAQALVYMNMLECFHVY